MGSENGAEYEFAKIESIAVASDSEIYVLDSGNKEIVHLSSDGHVLGLLGAPGEGPGEFRYPRAVAIGNDTVFVIESGRIHAFSRQGSLYYTSGVRDSLLAPGPGKGTLASELVNTASGLLAARHITPVRRPSDTNVHVDSIVIRLRPPDAGTFDTRAVVLNGKEWYPRGRGTSQFRKLLGATPHYALLSTGQIAYTRGEDYCVEVLGVSGTIDLRIIGEVEKKRISESEFKQVIRDFKEEMARQAKSHSIEDVSEFYDDVPRAEFRPILGRIVPGDSTILVERVDLAPLGYDAALSRAGGILLGERPVSNWDMIHLVRGLTKRIVFPPGFVPLIAAGQRVYGYQRTDMDVMVLVVFDI